MIDFQFLIPALQEAEVEGLRVTISQAQWYTPVAPEIEVKIIEV
jgi:hypothetical protein